MEIRQRLGDLTGSVRPFARPLATLRALLPADAQARAPRVHLWDAQSRRAAEAVRPSHEAWPARRGGRTSMARTNAVRADILGEALKLTLRRPSLSRADQRPNVTQTRITKVVVLGSRVESSPPTSLTPPRHVKTVILTGGRHSRASGSRRFDAPRPGFDDLAQKTQSGPSTAWAHSSDRMSALIVL